MKNTAKNTATKNTLATAAKAAAKAPKSDAPKTKLELFGEALNKYVRAHFDCVEKKDGKVYLRKVDLGKGPVGSLSCETKE